MVYMFHATNHVPTCIHFVKMFRVEGGSSPFTGGGGGGGGEGLGSEVVREEASPAPPPE